MMNFILFLVLFGILVFIHEFGHFIVARKTGVGVEKFFLGFGPKMFSVKRGETEYGINWIPLGGYVKLLGEDPSEQKEPNRSDRHFMAKTPLQRTAVVAAGPVSNLILPVLLFAGLYFVGVPSLASVIGEVVMDSPAQVAGLKQGDRVVRADGASVDKWDDLTKVIRNSGGKKIELDLLRDGKEIKTEVNPKLSEVENIYKEKVNGWTIGITPYQYEPAVCMRNNSSAAHRIGFRNGDIIRKVSGKEIKYFWQFEEAFRGNVGSSQLEVAADRETFLKRKSVSIVLHSDPAKGTNLAAFGIYPAEPYDESAIPGSIAVSAHSEASGAGLQTGDIIESANGKKISALLDMENFLKGSKDAVLRLGISRVVGKSPETVLFSVPAAKEIASLGFDRCNLFVGSLDPAGEAAAKGIKKGDMLVAADGKKISNWLDIEKIVQDGGAGPITFEIVRNGKNITATLVPRKTVLKEKLMGAYEEKFELGFEPFEITKEPPAVDFVESTYNPAKAIVLGVQKSWDILVAQVVGFGKLLTGKLSFKHIGGPIMIYKFAGGSFQAGGLLSFISAIALLSIVLGFVNLLPIPILDGGHIFFNIVEMIKRKPVSLKTREVAQQVGFVIIIALVLLASYNDINRYFWNGIVEFFKKIF